MRRGNRVPRLKMTHSFSEQEILVGSGLDGGHSVILPFCSFPAVLHLEPIHDCVCGGTHKMVRYVIVLNHLWNSKIDII